MNKFKLILTILLLSTMLFSFYAGAEVLKLADFDDGFVNYFGGQMYCWSRDKNDTTHGCTASLDEKVKHGDTGASLRLDYDVISPNPAYNGFKIELKEKDLSEYKTLIFWVKADEAKGCTKRFKVALKNGEGESSRFLVKGVNNKWQEIKISLEDFKGMSSFSQMQELDIVFDDVMADVRCGALYIDDIAFSTEELPEEEQKTPRRSFFKIGCWFLR